MNAKGISVADNPATRVEQADYRISDATAFKSVAVTIIVYVSLCATALYFSTTFVYVLFAAILGYVLQFFFNALHYCTHDTFVTSKRMNYLLGVLFGCITVMNFALYKPYHMQHHGHLFTDKDPEPTDREITSKLQYAYEMLAPLFFVDNWVQSLKTMRRTDIPNIFGRPAPYLSAEDRQRVVWNNGILLAWVCFIALLTFKLGSVVFWFYWLPLLTSLSLANFVILPEHYQTDQDRPIKSYDNSRTIKSGPLTRFFMVGLNYHAEHHLYPGVPYHNLPDINKRIGANVKYTHDSYLAFHWALVKSLPWRASGAPPALRLT